MISGVQFIAIAPNITVDVANQWTDALNQGMDQGQINTCLRQSAFLSQILVETGCFRWLRELWGPTPTQQGYANQYGNASMADAFAYRGGGCLMLTFKDNYRDCGNGIGIDLVTNPELISQPQYAIASAVWFWNTRNINAIADTDDIAAVTRRVNGGLNGFPQRSQYYNLAKQQLFC